MNESKSVILEKLDSDSLAHAVLLFYWPRTYTTQHCTSEEWCMIAINGWKALSLNSIGAKIMNDKEFLGDLAWCSLYAHHDIRPEIKTMFYEVIIKWIRDSPNLLLMKLGMDELVLEKQSVPDKEEQKK